MDKIFWTWSNFLCFVHSFRSPPPPPPPHIQCCFVWKWLSLHKYLQHWNVGGGVILTEKNEMQGNYFIGPYILSKVVWEIIYWFLTFLSTANTIADWRFIVSAIGVLHFSQTWNNDKGARGRGASGLHIWLQQYDRKLPFKSTPLRVRSFLIVDMLWIWSAAESCSGLFSYLGKNNFRPTFTYIELNFYYKVS